MKNVFVYMGIVLAITICGEAAYSKEYKTPYGTFYSPIDAACAHLYQEEAKSQLGSRWEVELSNCRLDANRRFREEHAISAPNQHQQAMPNPHVPTNGMSPTGAVLFGLGQAISQASEPAPAPTMPRMQNTNCHVSGSYMNCTTW